MIAYLFFFHMVHWSFIFVMDGCSAIIFVKHVTTVFVQFHNAVRMHELLLSCESSRRYHHAAQRTPTWTKIVLTFYKTVCCAAIHGLNVPNESRIVMLSVLLSFFHLEKFGVKPRFLFKIFFTLTVYSTMM